MTSQPMKSASESGTSDYESDSEGEEAKSKNVVTKEQQQQQQQQVPKQPVQQEEEDDDEDEDQESDTESNSEAGAGFSMLIREANSGGAAVAAAKSTAADNNAAGKRGRDANGGKGPVIEEPVSKKRKEAKNERPRSQAVKPSSPVKVEKRVEQGAKKVAAAKQEKVKPTTTGKVENGKAQGTRKRKASPPPASGARQQIAKGEADKSSPLKASTVKPRKPAQWTGPVELALAANLLKDKGIGVVQPNTKLDPYWEKLLKRLPHEGGDLSAAQLYEKVKRMRLRHTVLKHRLKEEGGKQFKSAHEEHLFKLWEQIWGASQPPVESDSDSESAETEPLPASRTIKAASVPAPRREESSSDEEEDEEEEGEENAKRKTAVLNEINTIDAEGKAVSQPPVVSPFVSKPKLEFTPIIVKDDRRKVLKKAEEVVHGDQQTGNVPTGDVHHSTNDYMKQLRSEAIAFFQDMRRNCFQLVEEIRGDRFGSLEGPGFYGFGKGSGSTAVLEGLASSDASPAAHELQRRWREHKVRELALLSERLQLLQEQCRLQQEELKLQNEKLDQQ